MMIDNTDQDGIKKGAGRGNLKELLLFLSHDEKCAIFFSYHICAIRHAASNETSNISNKNSFQALKHTGRKHTKSQHTLPTYTTHNTLYTHHTSNFWLTHQHLRKKEQQQKAQPI